MQKAASKSKTKESFLPVIDISGNLIHAEKDYTLKIRKAQRPAFTLQIH
jgi:hypothetical protein